MPIPLCGRCAVPCGAHKVKRLQNQSAGVLPLPLSGARHFKTAILPFCRFAQTSRRLNLDFAPLLSHTEGEMR